MIIENHRVADEQLFQESFDKLGKMNIGLSFSGVDVDPDIWRGVFFSSLFQICGTVSVFNERLMRCDNDPAILIFSIVSTQKFEKHEIQSAILF